MKRMASAGNGSKSNASSTKRKSARRLPVAAALCLKNGGCGDLELRKLYRILPDKKATAEGYMRIVDESGEDYLYPADYFVLVRIPAAAAKKLLVA
jgi:hypothetical protein